MIRPPRAIAPYTDRRVLMILPLGFASGLPLLLTFSTLSAWLATAGVSRTAIGAFALAGTPYAFKFVWAPLIDRLPPPLPFGRRRGWGLTIQFALIAAVLALGLSDPQDHLARMGALAVVVAFLSASQDIVIDAYRVELLTVDQQGPGAGMIQTGYRIAMLVAGAGALLIASAAGWFAAYATVATLLTSGMLVFILGPEPTVSSEIGASYHLSLSRVRGRASPRAAAEVDSRSAQRDAGEGTLRTQRAALESREESLIPRSAAGKGIRTWFRTAVAEPFADFMRRPLWPVILIFVVGYKLGEALAGVMATPLYISLGFTLAEIAAVSKLVGFVATIIGALLGGYVAARTSIFRALMLCGVLQSVGNLFYVLQALGGHRLGYLALCVAAENLTGAMAGAALVAYLSDLCSPAFTATQYALLSSLAAVGRTIVASCGGVLADALGWAPFFLLSTVVTIPALMLLIWIARRTSLEASPSAEFESAG